MRYTTHSPNEGMMPPRSAGNVGHAFSWCKHIDKSVVQHALQPDIKSHPIDFNEFNEIDARCFNPA
jgi:hypothetical protein